ncbi:peptide chain release factor N(5)-glutamine methyltransferase [Gilvimarinus algae]|uniref:Release factor glutamine methyltransferase n=1 Tax=Gilvimarinus algae TaxID=3058037 RepID=A0ABT8TCZ3_9GAMM|nr:peptide chain release factor N(5)-glutamine methyltransferase [Gilvimarinus sp. SDUM040014]MDO3381974.1 peptide chain release factor N(5)-glutamine methyltransferase [Gilvimarinus sp. SDUM040014]
MLTVAEALRQAARLNDVSDSARLDTEVLLAWVLGKSRSYLYTWPEATLAGAEQEHFEALMAARERGEPIAYLVGEQEFWSLPLKTARHTLIPRADTELLVEQALALALPAEARALDLGTGTGAIALALAKEKPRWTVLAVDRVAEAVALARENARRLQLGITVLQSDWFAALEGEPGFDLIVSNPPYIDADDAHLAQGDVRFEPTSALVAGGAGLDDLRAIAERARGFLNPGAWLLMEHGWQQGQAVRDLLSRLGYEAVRTHLDLAGHERITCGAWPHG